METVKLLTWEEAKVILESRITKRGTLTAGNYSCVGIPYEDAVKAVIDASSRVREVEEENAKLSGIVTHFEHEIELTKSLLEASEQENKRLQERLEAAEKYLDWNISSILHSDSSRELQIRLGILQELKQKYNSLKP